MGIFKAKKPKVETVVASPPESQETNAETQYLEELDSSSVKAPIKQTGPTIQQPQPTIEVREVPVCLSQTQINNMIIENNIMLKELMAMANED